MSCTHGNWEPCDLCDAIDEAYKRGYIAGGIAALTRPAAPGAVDVEVLADHICAALMKLAPRSYKLPFLQRDLRMICGSMVQLYRLAQPKPDAGGEAE
jgi:hypothetical protein